MYEVGAQAAAFPASDVSPPVIGCEDGVFPFRSASGGDLETRCHFHLFGAEVVRKLPACRPGP